MYTFARYDRVKSLCFLSFINFSHMQYTKWHSKYETQWCGILSKLSRALCIRFWSLKIYKIVWRHLTDKLTRKYSRNVQFKISYHYDVLLHCLIRLNFKLLCFCLWIPSFDRMKLKQDRFWTGFMTAASMF